jgi:hypothetical protein
VWQFTVGHRSAPHDASWGTTLDVNGDGLSDIAIGAPGGEHGGAFVFLGRVGGPAAAPSFTLVDTTTKPASYFGGTVASAGDVNGDGFADLAVVSAGRGKIQVHLGGASGVEEAPSFTLGAPDTYEMGRTVAGAGDLDGDGFADLVADGVSSINGQGLIHVFFGGPEGLPSAPSATLTGMAPSGHCGFGVASAGDLNGDGFADLVVGGSCTNQYNGAVYVYLGSQQGLPAAPSFTLPGADPPGWFGGSMAGTGDLDGDGFSDLVIGEQGAFAVYKGGPQGIGAAPSFLFPTPGGALEVSLAGAGDTNGDGYDDILVGDMIGAASRGAVDVYPGGPQLSFFPSQALPGALDAGQAGWSVSGGGDLDGDGFIDLVVGAPRANDDDGAVYVYLGRPGGYPPVPSVTLEGQERYGGFGSSVASAK